MNHNNNGGGISTPSHSRQHHPAPRTTCARIQNMLFPVFVITFVLASMALMGFLLLSLVTISVFKQFVFHVVNVSLTQFDLGNNNTLHYNLTIDMNVRNPNRVLIRILYEEIDVKAFYSKNQFDSVSLMPFKQGLRNTTTLHPILLQGETVLVPTPTLSPVAYLGHIILVPTPPEIINSKFLGEYNRDKSAGSFDIQVHIHTKIRYLVGRHKYGVVFKHHFECDLKRVPLISSDGGNISTTVGGFRTAKKCKELNY